MRIPSSIAAYGALGVMMAVGLSGCAALDGRFDDGSTEPAADASVSGAIVLQPGHKILINVRGRPEYSGIVTIASDGAIQHQKFGSIQLAEQSLPVAKERLAEAIRKRGGDKPQVSLDVLNLAAVTILGEVVNTGEYPFVLGLNLANLLTEAGGYTYRADTTRAFVTRRQGGKTDEIKISDMSYLRPGDVILVPQRYF